MRKIVFIAFCLIFFSCNNKQNAENKIITLPKKNYEHTNLIKQNNDTAFTIDYDKNFTVKTKIYYPKNKAKIKASIIMLHGWNLPANQWCDSTDFCEIALERAYVLIIPDFDKTNYCLNSYPETRDDLKKYPTITWIINTYIKYIQDNFNLLKNNQNNFAAGISTGGRGASLLAYYCSNIFNAVASLSGDFDIIAMKNSKFFSYYLGKYELFKDRWEKETFADSCSKYKVPTYIAHGQNDKVAYVQQSISFIDSLKKYQPNLYVKYNIVKNAEHDYKFWKSETTNILNFFDENCNK